MGLYGFPRYVNYKDGSGGKMCWSINEFDEIKDNDFMPVIPKPVEPQPIELDPQELELVGVAVDKGLEIPIQPKKRGRQK